MKALVAAARVATPIQQTTVVRERPLRHIQGGAERERAPTRATTDGGDFSLIPSGSTTSIPVYPASGLAARSGRRALSVGGGIHLAASSADLTEHQFDELLAHELVHVAQQRASAPVGDPIEAEEEAHRLAPHVLRGASPQPQQGAAFRQPLADTPHDEMVVAQAKRRLKLLEDFASQWQERQIRKLHSGQETKEAAARRRRIAEKGIDPLWKQRAEMEEQQVKGVNRLPLRIEVTEDAVRFHVSFQARFEDPKSEKRFGELEASLRKGIELVWNQRLGTGVFEGRRFSIEPEIALVAASAPRDRRAWLITVRPKDDSPVVYPGCKLPQPPKGDPTSVTESTCDGGVMSVPPRHIGKPDVLGHELLHLFGLLDRYLQMTQQMPSGGTRTTLISTRETGGRPDPLGAESGTILSEDLTFLFERYGVYRAEETRGLETLTRLEAEGLDIAVVRAEIEHQKEIIRLGRDPRSMIRLRKDFRDKVLQDLPP